MGDQRLCDCFKDETFYAEVLNCSILISKQAVMIFPSCLKKFLWHLSLFTMRFIDLFYRFDHRLSCFGEFMFHPDIFKAERICPAWESRSFIQTDLYQKTVLILITLFYWCWHVQSCGLIGGSFSHINVSLGAWVITLHYSLILTV